MTTIRATCSECDVDVELGADEFLVVVRDCGTGHYYTFGCPACQKMSRRHAEPTVVNLLMTHGARAHQLHVPQEALEIENLEAPAISVDEVLDFIGNLRTWTGEMQ